MPVAVFIVVNNKNGVLVQSSAHQKATAKKEVDETAGSKLTAAGVGN